MKKISATTDVRSNAVNDAVQLARDFAAGKPNVNLESQMAAIFSRLRPMARMRGEIVVEFETAAQFRGRNLCLEVAPRTIRLWPKGRRQQNTVLSIESEYEHGKLNDARLGRAC